MSNNKLKIIFAGTSDFGIPSLRALLKSANFEIIQVITQPDKKAGRRQLPSVPPLKTEALKYKIPVIQPDKILDYRPPEEKISLMVVIAYGQIIPEKLLNLPEYGAVNMHGSILPKYRGAACVQAAILNGDEKTGITFIKMDPGIDTGPILRQEEISVSRTDTGGSLYAKLSELGGRHINAVLRDYTGGKIRPRAQDNAEASYVKKLRKEDGHIDFKETAEKIERFIRAMDPWPGSFGRLDNKILKILKISREPLKINGFKPGEIIISGNKPAIQCGRNALAIEKLQLAGKKPLQAVEFIRGHADLAGKILN